MEFSKNFRNWQEFVGSGILDAPHDLQLVSHWEQVTEDEVKTPAEVYQDLANAGHHISFSRIPVTDEKAFESQDFDELVAVLRKAYFEDTQDFPAFIFNW